MIPTAIVPSVAPCAWSPQRVLREFHGLLDEGVPLLPVGKARRQPRRLLTLGYVPRFKVVLFGTHFYLTNVLQNDELRFVVAYVVQPNPRTRRTEIHPRLFYKDLSLVWRSGSHYHRNGDDLWVGKGDVEETIENGVPTVESIESTTDLPLELQDAVEGLLKRTTRIRTDERVLGLVLRHAPANRIEPYEDFTAPRRRAAEGRGNRIHGGRKIARFTRKGDPTSLVFAKGFAPDFANGVLEVTRSKSRLYHGPLRRFRILSRNRRIQYLFIAGRRQVWLIPPQATTTELSSYGVRTIDVAVDNDLCIPGYEYHFLEDGEWTSQIPEGYAGAPSEHDPDKADASPWLDRLPVVREFRRVVLGQKR